MTSMLSRRNFLAAVSAAGLWSAGGERGSAAEETTGLPTVKLGDLQVTRLIMGSNPFSGYSNLSAELSREMVEYYTPERIKQVLEEGSRRGIKTLIALANDHIIGVLTEYWAEGGGLRDWIAQIDVPEQQMDANIDRAADAGAKAAFIQGRRVDRIYGEGRLADLAERLERIKGKGLPAGLAAHRPDVHPEAERLGLPTDFYMQCFYNLAEHPKQYLAPDRDQAVAVIRSLPKPCIGYKVMAAGLNEPEEAYSFAFRHLKPSDAVCVGFFTKHRPHEIRQGVELTRKHAR